MDSNYCYILRPKHSSSVLIYTSQIFFLSRLTYFTSPVPIHIYTFFTVPAPPTATNRPVIITTSQIIFICKVLMILTQNSKISLTHIVDNISYLCCYFNFVVVIFSVSRHVTTHISPGSVVLHTKTSTLFPFCGIYSSLLKHANIQTN